MLDHDSFDVLGTWELDRGPQYLATISGGTSGYDTMITSEWGTPNMVEDGLNPEILLAAATATSCTSGICASRTHLQALDLGAEQQMVLELRPAHDPTNAYGFVGVVVSLKDLSASIWLWHRDNGKWAIRK